MSIRRYSPSQIALHWLSAVAVLLIIALPYGADFFAGLLGVLLNQWLSPQDMGEWGWRVPFLASVVVMIFAIWLRMNLKESPVFEKVNDAETVAPAAAQDTSLGAMFKSKSFWLATGLRFGQAGNSGLIQTFLAGYLVQTLLFDKAIPTDALMISSILGFLTIPLLGWLSDKVGRRLPYIILNISAIILAYPMLSIIVDKS